MGCFCTKKLKTEGEAEFEQNDEPVEEQINEVNNTSNCFEEEKKILIII